jgi:maleylpyruvate isomerase
MTIILHGYWRSSAAYRVRIALNLKGVAYAQQSHDLRAGAHRQPDYLALSPSGLVPALEADGVALTQSLAILEWLEERYPEPPLLPPNANARAAVRAMAAIVACDIHPINNLRTQKWLRTEIGATDADVQNWIAYWMHEGFKALETEVGRYGGQYSFGDTPTLADCTLIPQLYNARRFNVDLGDYPRLVAIDERCLSLEAFQAAQPDRQPDAE